MPRHSSTMKSYRQNTLPTINASLSHTLARFVEGPLNGVPSLFSLVFVVGSDSSLTGLTFKSAYFLQVVPHTSHRMFVGSPFGAFHQVLDSRVRHAPQLGVLDGCAMIDESSSRCPTR